MSEDIYFWNKCKKEYVIGYGNHNRKDSLRSNFPILFVWLMSHDWKNDNIKCIGDIDNDVYIVIKQSDKTNYYIEKFNKSGYDQEHGKFQVNKYAEDNR